MGRSVARWGAAAAVVAVGVAGVVASNSDEATTSVSVKGIDALKVEPEATASYDRSFFEHWVDDDGDRCDTRAEVLISESSVNVTRTKDCRVTAGKWESYFDGVVITDASDVDVDHLVPLAEAWRSGAWNWDGPQRRAYANDVEHGETLVAVSASANRSKGDKDPASWLPGEGRCEYVRQWVAVKREWELSIDTQELKALRESARSC